jgi:hypothetical protein
LALTIYCFIQTVRTVSETQSIEIIRWLFFFFALVFLCLLTTRQVKAQFKYIPELICILCLVYYVSYIGQGLYSETFLHISRFKSQGTIWAGSSYAVLPFVVGLPCGIWLFGHSLQKQRVIGALVGVCAVAVIFYYESRILLLLLVGCLIVSFFIIGWKNALIYLGIVLGTWLILLIYTSIMRSIDQATFAHSITIFGFTMDTQYFDSYKERTGEYFQAIATAKPMETDVDRIVHLLSPFNALKGNELFGYGTYQHHTILPQYFRELISIKYPELKVNISNFVRTTGFGAFITDYGFVGFGLLILNFICVGIKLIFNRSKMWLLLGVSLCFAFIWLFISNILDNVLWWLLIIPFGLLDRLNYEVINERKIEMSTK